MKAALSLMVTVCLAVANVRVCAQELTERHGMPGVFAASATSPCCVLSLSTHQRWPTDGRSLGEFEVKERNIDQEGVRRATVVASRRSIWVGGLLGFGIGAALGTTVGAEACLHEPRWHCAVKIGVPFAVIGAVIGWRHR